VTDSGASDADRLLDIELPHSFRGLDPEAVQDLLTDAVGSLRQAQEREVELRTVVAALEAELADARADATAELEEAKRRGRQMVTEAQTVRRRILEDLIRRRKVLRRQIEQLRVGRERLLEAYEVVGLTVEEATAELGVALPAAQAAAERAGRRLGPDAEEVTPEELHAIEAEIDAARVAGLPILEPPTPAERVAAHAAGTTDEVPEDEVVPPLVEVEPTLAAFEEMRLLGPVDHETEPEQSPDGAPAAETEPSAAPPGSADAEIDQPAEVDAAVEPETESESEIAAEAVEPEPEIVAGAAEAELEIVAGADEPECEIVAESREPESEIVAGVDEPECEIVAESREPESEIVAGVDEPESEIVAGADEAETETAPEPVRDEALTLPLFDRLRAGEAESAVDVVEAIEAEPGEGDAPDPVAVLADDLARRLRRALADEQNQVLDRLRQDRKGQLDLDGLLGDTGATVVRLATAIEPRLREAASEGTGTDEAGAADLAARLAGQVADGVRADIDRQVAVPGAGETDAVAGVDLARPVREAFRGWRTDRILPMATEVAAEVLGS